MSNKKRISKLENKKYKGVKTKIHFDKEKFQEKLSKAEGNVFKQLDIMSKAFYQIMSEFSDAYINIHTKYLERKRLEKGIKYEKVAESLSFGHGIAALWLIESKSIPRKLKDIHLNGLNASYRE